MTQVIALHGYAQSGKDTVAAFLKEHGYERLAFADALRDVLYALNPLVLRGMNGSQGWDRLATIVNEFGWDRAKVQFPEVRTLMQRMGTEAGRQVLGDSIWVDIVLRQIKERPSQRFVITDMRFENELAALTTYGSDVLLAKIVRPGVGAVNAHVSDAGLPDDLFDVLLRNEGDLDDLHELSHALPFLDINILPQPFALATA